MKAARAGQRRQVESLERRIQRAEQVIGELESGCKRFQLHHKKRRLGMLRKKLVSVQADIAAGRVRVAFGSKKLWRRQFSLAENGYASHGEWRGDWHEARRDEFFVLGSKDETSGCQLCVAAVSDDGSLSLRLRIPDCLVPRYGKYVTFMGVRFAYGHEAVLAALLVPAGQAICYRFKRDEKGWRVFVSTKVAPAPVVTDSERGAVGVDINADHLAVGEIDADGNWLRSWRVPLVAYGKSQRQAEALIGDAVARVVEYAREAGKPIVIEKLDFSHKKLALEGESRKYSRMLSSFSYGKVKAYFLSRGYREGVEVHQVNPAFSSVIGRVKFMERYGLSVHQAAALVLARRLLGCSERIPRRWVAPVGNGVHVAFSVPVRKRVKHVWTYWGAISGQLRPALAAQHRLGKRKRRPNPAQAVSRAAARGAA